jgi:hypothetical protein
MVYRIAAIAVPKAVELSVVLLGSGIFALWALLAHPEMTINYRYSNEPLPNQGRARVLYLIAAAVLVLGGLWGLCNAWLLPN